MDFVGRLGRIGVGGMAQVTLRRLHRVMALGLATFVVVHLVNHAMILFGPESHRAMMDTLRLVYRNPVIEFALIAGFAAQIAVGSKLLYQRGKPRHFWGWMQVASGAALGLFLIQHIIAAVVTRIAYPAVPTDIYWAASVVSRPAFAAYFAPYYTIGVAALFVHIAAVFAIRRKPIIAWSVAGGGLVLAVGIVAGLMGAFHPIPLPAMNEAYLDGYWGLAD